MRFFKDFLQGLEDVAFPAVCAGCSASLGSRDRYLCEECAESRFDDPNPSNETTCEEMVLPEGVDFQDALWKYDKEGVLQQLIHMLKYEGMAGVGTELGSYAARRIKSRHIGSRIKDTSSLVLMPVPLHPKRQKKRGYNQARLIAEGIASVLEADVAPEDVLVRSRHTHTQTRHNLEQRMQNLQNAFSLERPEYLSGRSVLIIDDVFTTGSTCFTLAEQIRKARPETIGIFTIGMA